MRRGCTEIYCFDATAGAAPTALGNAASLARCELGVEIDVNLAPLAQTPEMSLAGATAAVGEIRYASGEIGRLVYVQTLPTGDMPLDSRILHEMDPHFPYESTLDQMLATATLRRTARLAQTQQSERLS